MRRMLDLTDIKDFAGKKLYSHSIMFNYIGELGAGAGVSGEYHALILSPQETPFNDDNGGVEGAIETGIFLRGNGSPANNHTYFILNIPDGGIFIGYFLLFNLDLNTVESDGNEEFHIISDTVTEWN